jgi:integrase
MSEVHSTRTAGSGKAAKPEKPYADFPLFPHASGYWAKKIRGKMHYFGPWSDWKAALDKYQNERDALHAGRKPREEASGSTVKQLANRFLKVKENLVDVGELSPRTWKDYKDACDALVSAFGKTRVVADLGPDDFTVLRPKLAKKWGAHRLAKTIQCIRSVFKFGFESGILATPMRYGPGFNRPSKKTLRLLRAEAGPKLLAADEVRRLIDAAGTPMKAMLLLGINCGFGNGDCGSLPLSALDLTAGLVDFPRPKTGIPRRAPLWPETVAAIQEALARRPEPRKEEHKALVFVTKYGDTWGKDTSDNPISKEMAKLLKALELNGRKGIGFYVLRHTFRTVADEAKDQPATDFIMGHERPSTASESPTNASRP